MFQTTNKYIGRKMKNKLTLSLVLLLSLLFFQSCNDSINPNTTKNLAYDDISDITYMHNSFYTTNNDLSLNAGSQIDLFRFEKQDQNIFLVDNFDLGLNGQGYFAITNDSLNIFLQSKRMSTIFCYSAIGELLYISTDSISLSWQPSGICFIEEKDSLLLLYKNLNSPKEYRARIVDKLHPFLNGFDKTFSFGFIDPTEHGIYAIDYYESSFYLLGVDSSQQDILIRTNYDFEVTSVDTIADSTVTGLCFDQDDLYLGYQNKRIELWRSY